MQAANERRDGGWAKRIAGRVERVVSRHWEVLD
jgi:hypothetical protein